MLSPSYGRGVTVKSGSRRTRTHMEAVYPSFEEMRAMYPTSGGRFLNDLDLAEKKRVVFLGDSIAYRLFGAEGAVGKTVWIDDLPFTVVGTMQTKLQFGMNNGPDADRAIIPASTFRTIYGGRYVNSILVRPRSVAEVEVVKKKVYETLGRRYKFDPTDERALGIWDMVEQEKNNYRMTFGIQIFLGVVGAMTLLVAGVGVANIMYVTVRERTREIGTKLAVGARKRHIVAQFLFEALTICLLGGAAGLLVAATVVQLVAHIPPGNMAMEILMHPRLSWPIALGTVSILTLIGFVAGVFPARKAASVDPVESLRYE
jgi:putative ABC transport system permease protein